MSAALSLTALPPTDWRTIAPEEWPLLVDLIGTPDLPMPRPVLALLPSLPPTRTHCLCRNCNQPRQFHLADDVVEEPRRALGVGYLGAREPHEPSRMRSGFFAAYGREPKSEDELGDFVFATRGSSQRTSRANCEPKGEPPRERRELSPAERDDALVALKSRRVRAPILQFGGGRMDWVHEVLIEIENPPANLARPTDLNVRIDLAAGRLEKRWRKAMRFFCLDRSLACEGDSHDDCE